MLAVLMTAPAAHSNQFRAYWADAWHNGFFNPDQTTATVNFIRSCNCNAIIVQVSKVADSYYISSYFPRATNVQEGYDALADVITKAHAQGLEVHAWVCTYRCWTQINPAPWPEHVYNVHPDWLSQTSGGAIYAGTESFLDPGHPAAMKWLVDAYMEIVTNYDIDGIHFDRIRYAGTDWGYNPYAVSRFNKEYGRTGSPSAGDPTWTDWRRAQISAFVKQMYCKTMAVKPHVKVAASVWKTALTGERDYLQDWNAWTEGHYIDYVCPMNYTTSNSTWTSNNLANAADAFGRHVYPGQDTCGNSAENTAWQVNNALTAGNPGVAMYSYACATTAHRDALLAGPFSSFTSTAAMSWKSSPTKGILMGTITNPSSIVIYGAQVSINGTSLSTTTDGTGFFGIVDVTPGTYTITVSKCGYVTQVISGVAITAGTVAPRDVTLVPDGIPPVISNVQATQIQATNAVITWTTDEPATSQVQYGLTTGYGNTTTENTLPKTSHSVQILNLTANTPYHYRVISKDCANATSTSTDYVFTTTGYDVPADIIKDNADPSGIAFSGSWITSSYTGQWATDYRYCSGAVQGKTCTWTPTIITPGSYNVYAWWVQGANRATNAPYYVQWAGGSQTVYCDQTTNGSQWIPLVSTKTFNAGTSGYVRLSNTNVGSTVNVIADAIKWESNADFEPPTTPTNFRVTGVTTSRVDLAWNASTDNKGISGYKVYRGAVNFTTVPTLYASSTGLLANAQYTYRVAAVDTSNNVSPQTDPINCYTLPQPPSAENVTCDRSTNTWYDTSLFTFSATDGFGIGLREYYRVAWNNSPTYTFTGGEEHWGSDTYGASCEDPGVFYLHLQSCNGDGVPNGTLDIGPFKYDNTPPVVGVTDDGAYTDASGQLHAGWTGSDPDSGVTEYRYAVGTTSGGTDVLGWTSAETDTEVTTAGLSLISGRTYYVAVKALNGAGSWSDPASSDGIQAATVFATIPQAKNNPDGTPVILNGKVVSANFNTFFYICENDPGDHTAGIRVAGLPPTQGYVGNVGGIIQTIGGERVLTVADVIGFTAIGGGNPDPSNVINRDLGGSALNAYTPGITGAVGVNNIGLLITTTGRVTYSGTGYCYINDGSLLNDGSGYVGVKVDTTRFTTPPELNDYVKITGISAVEMLGGDAIRLIRPRGDGDLWP